MKKFFFGQSLFELVVAIGIVGLILVAIISVATVSVRNTTFSKEQAVATRYTQQAMEWLRGQRDTDWDSFKARGTASGVTWCLNNLNWSSAGGCGNRTIANTNYKREAELVYNAAAVSDEVRVTVVTSWEGSSGVHEARASTTLTNWKAK